jgi:hypothetical protein
MVRTANIGYLCVCCSNSSFCWPRIHPCGSGQRQHQHWLQSWSERDNRSVNRCECASATRSSSDGWRSRAMWPTLSSVRKLHTMQKMYFRIFCRG